MSKLKSHEGSRSLEGFATTQERNYYQKFQDLIHELEGLTLEVLGTEAVKVAERRSIVRQVSHSSQDSFHFLTNDDQSSRDLIASLPKDDRPSKPKAAIREENALVLQAAKLYKSRRTADSCFDIPYFSGTAGFDIMLDLYMARLKGTQVSVTSACIGSGNPATTALRWINILLDKKMIVKQDDPGDQRRFWVDLTSTGESKVIQVLKDLQP